MGYSRSPLTVERRQHLLKVLADGEECEWSCAPNEERVLAYKIREALFVAQNYAADQFPELASAANNFTISETGNGKVIARRKLNLNKVSTNERPQEPKPIAARIEGTQNLTQIIAFAQNAPKEDLPFHFPETQLTDDELLKLNKWLREHNLLLFVANNAVTVHAHDPELEDLAFCEEDLQE